MNPEKSEPQEEIEIVAENDLEVEVVDDTPEADRGRVPRVPPKDDVPDEDELKTYSEGVQQRLRQLTGKFHAERRLREQQQRERDEAISYARRKDDEAKRLREMLQSGEKVLVEQAKGRVEAQLSQARRELKEAYESGDTEKMVKAQEEISRLQIDTDRIQNYQPVQVPQEQPAPRAAARPADPKFNDWHSKNTWFRSDNPEDRVMTSLAFGLHEQAVLSGITPDTDAYYGFIDRGMRQRFPERFQDQKNEPSRPRNSGTVVAPSSRQNGAAGGNTPRKVTLTTSQVALAKRLNIPLEAYARELMKQETR